MPVTAKLSKRFYEVLGEQVVNELVDWFNSVDTSYKADLRELNELNFARFDAKLEQRIAETNARMDAGFASLEADLGRRIVDLEARLGRRIVDLEAKFEARFAAVDAKMDVGFAKVDQRFAELRADMLKWMFLFWTATMLTVLFK